jgi:hypothetical protein
VISSLFTVTTTGDEPGFRTRIGIAALSPGCSVTGSGGTETAIERGPLRLGTADGAAATPSGTAMVHAMTATTPASHPLSRLPLVLSPRHV